VAKIRWVEGEVEVEIKYALPKTVMGIKTIC
jgi:hypothetical protein